MAPTAPPLDMTSEGLAKEYFWLLALSKLTTNQFARKELILTFAETDPKLAGLIKQAQNATQELALLSAR